MAESNEEEEESVPKLYETSAFDYYEQESN